MPKMLKLLHNQEKKFNRYLEDGVKESSQKLGIKYEEIEIESQN